MMISTMDMIMNAGERFGTEKSQTPGSFAVEAAMLFAVVVVVVVIVVQGGRSDTRITANSRKERAKRNFERLEAVKGRVG